MSQKKKLLVPQTLAEMFGSRLKRYSIEAGPRVYFLVKRGEVVYVGKTKHLTKRLHQHFQILKDQFDSVYYLDVCDGDLDEIELEMISACRPRLNTSGLTLRTIPGLGEVNVRARPIEVAKHYFAGPPRRRAKKPSAEALELESLRRWLAWEARQPEVNVTQ
jgi:hypothetical protein